MSVFPSCTFDVEVEGGALVPGRKNTLTLRVRADEAMPRATRLEATVVGEAWATSGSTTDRETFLRRPAVLELPHGLGAGVHRYAFSVDVPADLQQPFVGDECGAAVSLDVRLDVDWALDPTASLTLNVDHPPGRRTGKLPRLVRSPAHVHAVLSLEVTLESSVVAQGEPLVGSLALRAGHDVGFRRLSRLTCSWPRGPA